MPKAVCVGVFINPTNPVASEATLRELRAAAPAMGLQIQVVNASTISEINAAFAALNAAVGHKGCQRCVLQPAPSIDACFGSRAAD